MRQPFRQLLLRAHDDDFRSRNQALVGAVALVAVDMLVSWLFDRLENAHPHIVIGHIEYATRLIVALAFVRLRALELPTPWVAPPGQRVRIPRAIWSGGAALATASLLVGAWLLLAGFRPPPPPEAMQATFSSGRSLLGLCTILLISAPLVEEVIYRAILLPPLLARLPVAAAFAVNALIFTVLHVGPYGDGLGGFVEPLVGGIVFSAVFWARRSLPAAVLAHSLANGLAVAVNVAYVFSFRLEPTWFQ